MNVVPPLVAEVPTVKLEASFAERGLAALIHPDPAMDELCAEYLGAPSPPDDRPRAAECPAAALPR